MNGMLSLDQSPKGGRDFGLVFNPIFKEEVEIKNQKEKIQKKTKRSIATSRLELETDIPAVFLAVGEEDLQKENLAKASGRSGPTPES